MSDRKNSEGYSDPTAYQAMMNLEIEELRFKKLLRSIKDVMHINSVFSILGQMGVGPKKGFAISGADEKWSDFLEDDPGRLALVKSYMHLKVRLLFDLPTASSAVDAMNRQISEFEWRLFVAADNAAREEESQNG